MELSAKERQVRQMAAGGGAGILSKTVVAPFERVKIVCQTGEAVGMMRTVNDIWASEGVRGFWRGNAAACVRVVPHKAILFGCSDVYKDLLRFIVPPQNTPTGLPPWASFAAGSMAGFSASVLTYPLDLVRTRLSGRIGKNIKYNSIVQTFVVTVKQEGPRALFRGIGPTLFGSIPYEGIKFGTYDTFKTIYAKVRPVDPESTSSPLVKKLEQYLSKMVCGGGAGLAATIVMYPNDTVRRRLQMQGQDGETRLYKNAVDCYLKLLRKEGITVFYRGMVPTLVRAIPNMGVQFASYDFLKGLFIPN